MNRSNKLLSALLFASLGLVSPLCLAMNEKIEQGQAGNDLNEKILDEFCLGDELAEKINMHNKQEEEVTQELVDNILKIRLDKPFMPDDEELKKIGAMRNSATFPSPKEELVGLSDGMPEHSFVIKFMAWLFPSQVNAYYESWGKKLWQFAAENVRDELVAYEIWQKYLENQYPTKCGNEQTMVGHTRVISCLAELSNGNLASGSYDNTIKIWNINTGNCTQTLIGHIDAVKSLAKLSKCPRGKLASGSYDNTIKIWDPNTGNCTQTLTGHALAVTSLVELSNGKLASGSYDHTIKIWNLNTGNCVKTLIGHTDIVVSLIELSNGNLASASYDNTIKIWDPNTGNCAQTLIGHTSPIAKLTELSNDKFASTSPWDKTIKIWNLNGNCIQTLTGHIDSVANLIKLSNGTFASISPKNTIKIWDLNAGSCIQTLTGNTENVWSLVELSNGRIASGSCDNTIKISQYKISAHELNTMQSALVANLFNLKNQNDTTYLHQQWQAVFDTLPKYLKNELISYIETE